MEQEQNDKNVNGRRKKKFIRTFLITMGITFAICVVAVIAGVSIYNNTIGDNTTSEIHNELTEEELAFEKEKEELGDINKTIAVFGVDIDEVRTDVIFVVNFNTETKKVKVVSVPRDTKVIWTEKQKRSYKQLTGYSINISKLNEMAAYGRINQNLGNIRDFTIDELENILKIHIDNYILINLDAFNVIVDAIGGVDMYVPQDMYYVDNYQGLYINLKEGMQHLDGAKAQQLVRFRSYLLGDEARIQVQQTFMKELAEKVMGQDVKSLTKLVTKLFPYIKTDIKLSEALDYLKLLSALKTNGLSFYTVPGEGDNREGPSYYYIDRDALDDMIEEVFYDTEVLLTDEDIVEDGNYEIDTNLDIALYNATGNKTVTSYYKEILQSESYNLVKIGNYVTTGLQESMIYARNREKALQFLPILKGATIIGDPSLDFDIELIIGKESIPQLDEDTQAIDIIVEDIGNTGNNVAVGNA